MSSMARMGITYGRRPKQRNSPGGVKGVVEAWKRGEAAEHGSVRTDGQNIFFDKLKLGWTDDTGKKVAVRYTGAKEITRDVTRVVRAALAVAQLFYEPGRDSVYRWRKILDA